MEAKEEAKLISVRETQLLKAYEYPFSSAERLMTSGISTETKEAQSLKVSTGRYPLLILPGITTLSKLAAPLNTPFPRVVTLVRFAETIPLPEKALSPIVRTLLKSTVVREAQFANAPASIATTLSAK